MPNCTNHYSCFLNSFKIFVDQFGLFAQQNSRVPNRSEQKRNKNPLSFPIEENPEVSTTGKGETLLQKIELPHLKDKSDLCRKIFPQKTISK